MKFLIVNFDNLGDVVFSSWISDFLSKQFPDATIDVLCNSYTKEVAACYPGINELYHVATPWRSVFEHKKVNPAFN